MLEVLPVRLLPVRSVLGKEHLSADLARFSLDPSLAGFDSCHYGPVAPYPSPPMSGSPPLSDLPESQYNEPRQHQEPRRSSRNTHQENAPRTDPETGRRGSPPAQQRQPPWTTSRPPPSSPAIFQGLSAPVVLGLRGDPRSSQGEHILLPPSSSSQTSSFHQARVSPRSPRAPRPPKTHVASACQNCRTAHLACDVNRPCARCVATGKQSTCIDVPHKRRGRPRIRPLGETRPAAGPGLHGQQRLMRPSMVTPHSSPAQIGVPLMPGPYRPLRPYVEELVPSSQTRFPGYQPHTGIPIVPAPFDIPGGVTRPTRSLAWAFLRMDFVFVKTSASFQQSLGTTGIDLGGMRLRDIIVEHDRSRIDRLEREMQEERARRDPAYLPPIYPGNEAENVQRVQEAEIAEVTQGSQERVEELTFVQPDGQLRTCHVQFKLAKTFIYFVVIILQLEASPVQQLSEPPPPLAYPLGYPSGQIPLPSYGAQVPFPYVQPSRTGPSSSGYSGLDPPHYLPRDPGQFVAGPAAAYRSPGSRPQTLGYFSEELSPLGGTAGAAAATTAWEASTTSSMPGRRASAPQPQPRPQRTREYRGHLQLPPLRRGPEPSQAAAPEAAPETGQKRGQEEVEEGEQEEGDERTKRPRMSVKEMLE